MSEIYKGVKFSVVFKEKKPLKSCSKKIKELISWCKRFDKLDFTPPYGKGSAGNFSFRTKNGFVITPSAVKYSKIKPDDFVEVLKVDIKRKKVTVNGIRQPSSETIMHHLIYEKLKNKIDAIFHVHDELVLKNAEKLNLPITKKHAEYGTLQLAREVLKILNKKVDYVVIKNHGSVAVGRNLRETGNVVLKINKKIYKNKN